MHTRSVFVLLFSLSAIAFAQTPTVKVFQEQPPTAPSPDWDGRDMPADMKAQLKAEKYEKFPTPAGQKPTFSGRVAGVGAGDSPEIAVISLIGVHWLKNDNYEWSAVNPDGSFSITAEKNPQARHALVVKAMGHPWTFFRAEFAPTESARNIEINVPPAKTVRITAETSDSQPVPSFKAEVFNAYKMLDNDNHELRRQRYGYVNAKGGEITMDIAEPVGVLISGNGIAPAYEIIDPKDGDEFHFILMHEAILTGTVTRDGKPVADQRVSIINEGAALSASGKKTDKDGRFTAAGRTPGKTEISVGKVNRTVELREGEQTDVTIELNPATGSSAATKS
jgi:hypothetical protein